MRLLSVFPIKVPEDENLRYIPKSSVMDCVRCLKTVIVQAPVHIEDVILENAAGTGTDIIATKNIGKTL